MDKYNSIEELANNTADYLSMGMIVYCDPENLTAAGIFENWLFEYSEYLELDDKEFEEIRKGDDRWQIDHAQFLREAVSLPVTIESPESRKSTGAPQAVQRLQVCRLRFQSSAGMVRIPLPAPRGLCPERAVIP